MTKNDYIIPEQCRKCGTLFDLSYDLSGEDSDITEAREKIGKKLSEYLCWTCKEEVIKIMSVGNDEENTEDLSEDSLLDDELD